MVEFWSMAPSPPCRAVMITAKAVGVELKTTEVDLMKGKKIVKILKMKFSTF